jgi:Uma2 family endonuclease
MESVPNSGVYLSMQTDIVTSYLPYTELAAGEAGLTDEQVRNLMAYSNVKYEVNAQQHIILMPPTGGETGRVNLTLGAQLYNWNFGCQLGYVFDSNTMFVLPNRAQRSPDAAWVERSRYEALEPAVRERFLPLVPDFVIELISPSDWLRYVQDKMEEYQACGVRLGWLLHRREHWAAIYRAGQKDPEIRAGHDLVLSGENVLPGFELRLAEVW